MISWRRSGARGHSGGRSPASSGHTGTTTFDRRGNIFMLLRVSFKGGRGGLATIVLKTGGRNSAFRGGLHEKCEKERKEGQMTIQMKKWV